MLLSKVGRVAGGLATKSLKSISESDISESYPKMLSGLTSWQLWVGFLMQTCGRTVEVAQARRPKEPEEK